MDLKPQKSLAAKILNVGESRVWISPDYLEEVSLAIRRDDIRRLIHEGKITKKPIAGISRSRARVRQEQKRKGLRYKAGSRKGSKYAKISKKTRWMMKIRAIRSHLKQLRSEKTITYNTYRRLYQLSSGGVFRSKTHVDSYIKNQKLKRRR